MKIIVAALLRRSGRAARNLDPVQLVVLGYASYVAIGWALLCLPWSRQAGAAATWLDHLFIATSAVSTTGLVTVSTSGTYSWLGEAVVLVLIQLGGLGYMTVGSCTLMAFSGGRLESWRARVGAVSLAMPPGFDFRRFLALTVGFSVVVELAGACLLFPIFRDAGLPNPAWQAVFHSVSAFCTAGFGLLDDSFESLRADPALNLIVIALSYLGAIGFIVVHDAWDSLTGRKAAITFTSKIILASTLTIGLVATLLLALTEPSIRDLAAGDRWLTAWFQAMTASTTVGFNTIPIGDVSNATLFFLTVVMIVGASPSGTGGGVKTTTVTAVWAVMVATLRRREHPALLGRRIPVVRVRAAIAALLLYSLTLAAGIFALALLQPEGALADQVFECISALGTVGLSRGITGDLNFSGRLVVIVLMFVGRVGPLALGTGLFRKAAEPAAREEDVVV